MSFIVFSFVVGLRIYYLFICIYYHFYRSIICVASFAPVIDRQFHRVRFRPTISCTTSRSVCCSTVSRIIALCYSSRLIEHSRA